MHQLHLLLSRPDAAVSDYKVPDGLVPF